MRRCRIFFACFLFPILLFGQTTPKWINDGVREYSYPNNVYYTAFLSETLNSDESVQVKTRLENVVKRKLAESIRIRVTSKQTINEESSQGSNIADNYRSYVAEELKTSADVEIVGIKTESYFDKSVNTVYAFAYANKYELIGYYKSNLSVNLNQIESFVKTAQDLETNGEKAKARQQLELAKPIFSKVRYAQDLLTAIDVNVSAEDLQQAKAEQLYNSLTQMQARLAQAVLVYVQSKENLFGQKVDIVANKLKAELAKNGCSFVENADKADFKLTLSVNTRKLDGATGEFAFAYADVVVDLFDNHKKKSIYHDEISKKGGSNTHERAARKAMEDVSVTIKDKLINWVQ